MPYIPNFNKISLQEQAYAPSLMRQQHDEAVTKQMELADALKFDYLKQDASILEPVLNKYSEDIQKVSTDLAKQGFTQDTKSKLLGLRSQYTTDDKIRQVKKNYEDATSQWDELRKRMIQEGRSGDKINRQKEMFFSGYKGAFSPEGDDKYRYKNEFTSGRTSGDYDIGEYALKAASKLGHTGTTINGGKDQLIPRKDESTGDTYYEVRNVSDGKLISNISQVDAIKKYVIDQFGTEGTDENLYARIEGITPDRISETVNNVLNSQIVRDETAPRGSSSFTGFTKGSIGDKQPAGGNPLSTFPRTTGDTDTSKEAHKDLSTLTAPLPQEISGVGEFFRKLKSSGVGDASSQKVAHDLELKKIQSQAIKEKQDVIERQRKKYPRYFNQKNPDGTLIDPFVAAQRGIQNDISQDAKIYDVTGINVSDNDFDNRGMVDILLNEKISKVYNSDEPIFKKQPEDRGIFSKDEYRTVEDYKSLWPNKSGYEKEISYVDEKGDIMIPHPKTGKLLTVNPKAFDNATQDLQSNVLKPLLRQLNDPTTFDKSTDGEIQAGRNMNLYFDVIPARLEDGSYDPYNTELRQVVMYQKDPQTGKKVLLGEPMSPPDAKDLLVKGIFNGFKSVDLIIKPTR